MSIEFKLPDLGENIEAGDVVSVLVSEGDQIQADQPVLELETDKAVLEVPCPHAGIVVKVHVEAGDKIDVGELVLTLTESAAPAAESDAGAASTESQVAPPEPVIAAQSEEAPAPSAPAVAAQPESPRTQPALPTIPSVAATLTDSTHPPAPAGPATRRLARELGVDLYAVRGSGPGGRITAVDVKSYVKQLSKPTNGASLNGGAPPLPDFSQWGPIERERLSGIRRATAQGMSVAWRVVPHVTQFDVADITDLEAARKRYEKSRDAEAGKMTVTVLALKAVGAALKAFPRFNSSLDTASEELIYKKYFHVGVAVDTPNGLLVPVVRDVDQKPLTELALELTDLAGRARDRKIDLEDMRGGCFTITNLGGIGGVGFTPIVNYPEVAILGMARGRWEVVPDPSTGDTRTRLQLPLSLSYDHRVIDGADAARFLRYIAVRLADPFQLLVEV